MSLDGNSRISEFHTNREMVRRSRTRDLSSSSDVDQTRASIDRLRSGLEANSSDRKEGPGYVNGKFSIRHFLDHAGVGREGFKNDGIGDRFMTGGLNTEKSLARKAELEQKREELRKEIKQLETSYLAEKNSKNKADIEDSLVIKNQTLEAINYQMHLIYGQDLANDNTGFIQKQQKIVRLESRKTEIDAQLARISSPVIPGKKGRTSPNPNHDPQRTEELRKELTDLNSELARLKS
jgi:hypothetical protein